MLSNAYALAQFYDRDAPAEMAKAGMEGFQEFMVKPTIWTRFSSVSRRPASASTSKLQRASAGPPRAAGFPYPSLSV